MDFLQRTMTANAVFSGASGLILAIFHQKMARLFGLENAGSFFLAIGAGLLGFAVFVFFESQKRRKNWVHAIAAMDFGWVVGSAFLLLFDPFGFSSVGKMLVVGCAAVVLFFGLGQWSGLKKLD